MYVNSVLHFFGKWLEQNKGHEFYKFSNKCARLQESMYHMTFIEEVNVSETAVVYLKPLIQV